MYRLFLRWLRQDDGQDLIEYALLSSFVGFAGYAALGALGDLMQTTYKSWDTAVQSKELVQVPDPQAP